MEKGERYDNFGSSNDIEFVNPVPPELEVSCSICLDVLKEPQLTQCCGHHFCLSCLVKVQKDNKPCPLCKESNVKGVLNKGLQRTINGLKIYCPMKSRGCSWQGEVRGLPDHLQKGSREGECIYVAVFCANGCRQKIERNVLKKHENEDCPKRPTFDPIEVTRRLQELIEDNEELQTTVDRLKKVNDTNEKQITHLITQMKTCFAEITLLKQQMFAVADDDKDRLSKLMKKTDDVPLVVPELPTPDTKVPKYSNPSMPLPQRVVPYEFEYNNYERRCQHPELWFCRPFYTHMGGYKMCVRVAPQGLGHGERTHVSVHSYLMKGEYDDMQVWPFRGAITIQLLNQLNDECHHEQTSDFNDRTPEQYCKR